MPYQIAQINIARMLAPLDTPQMADFMNNLDQINALAESASGFVWRLVGDGNDATSLRPFPDDWVIVNMSVWKDIDSLYQFTYYSNHTAFYRRRSEWFEKPTKPIFTMWWIPEGHIPTVKEAKDKLDYLEQHGATPLAFTFKQRFTAEEMLAVSQA